MSFDCFELDLLPAAPASALGVRFERTAGVGAADVSPKVGCERVGAVGGSGWTPGNIGGCVPEDGPDAPSKSPGCEALAASRPAKKACILLSHQPL